MQGMISVLTSVLSSAIASLLEVQALIDESEGRRHRERDRPSLPFGPRRSLELLLPRAADPGASVDESAVVRQFAAQERGRRAAGKLAKVPRQVRLVSIAAG